MATDFREQIIANLDRLTPDQQKKVLDFTTLISSNRPVGVPGKALRPFFGILSEEEADEMMRIIDEDCGRVNENEW
jgi:hypothetical protein